MPRIKRYAAVLALAIMSVNCARNHAPMVTSTQLQIAQPMFLKVQGTKLFLGGKEFREVSFNFHHLLHFYLPKRWDGNRAGKADVKTALEDLAAHGFTLVRVNVSPFYVGWMNEVFYDDDPEVQKAKRNSFFSAFDEMLLDCGRNGISIIATLMWNVENMADLGHHSLREGITDEHAMAFAKYREFVGEVVSRYRQSSRIAMWENGNEWDLYANLQKPEGTIDYGRKGGWWPEPVVRDGRNNFTSRELADFQRRAFAFIRGLDPNHLVTTGNANIRLSSLRMLKAVDAGKPVDWTKDTDEERFEHLRLVEGDADVVQVHYYDTEPGGMVWYKNAADRLGMPLLIGEGGSDGKDSKEHLYTSQEAHAYLMRTLPIVRQLDIPVYLFWTYGGFDMDCAVNPQLCLRYGSTDRALSTIAESNRQAKLTVGPIKARKK